MLVKTEFILKYYSQEACRGNLFNVIRVGGGVGERKWLRLGRRNTTWY